MILLDKDAKKPQTTRSAGYDPIDKLIAYKDIYVWDLIHS